jgi:hypothetical protein
VTQVNQDILDQTLDAARSQLDRGGIFTAVFDLDSTLFEVQPRVLRILHEFAADNAMRSLYPEACMILERAQTLKNTYKLKEQLLELGLNNQVREFYPTIFQYWQTRFFDHDYLKYDVPYEGAIAFVSELYQLGATIIYLTGRDVARMGRGTEESLAQWNFPLGKRVHLALKPDKEMDDAEFKRDYLMSLPRENSEIWFYENEPVNIELVLREVNHVRVVYFDSVHMEKAEPPGPHIPRIRDFRRALK